MADLIIHGGAGRLEGLEKGGRHYEEALTAIFEEVEDGFRVRGDAREAVLDAVRRLESHPLFNAGLGSRLQRDGRIRMSAALMDGSKNLFSAVINVGYVEHPVDLAARLAHEEHHVLAGEEATAHARGLGIPFFDPLTDHRLEEHRRREAGALGGTVGAVARDDEGNVFAATSTGGVGFETPGRVSDSATVAGTYAESAAISCTGIGEEIVQLAVAARVAVRVTDGLPLQEAVRRTVTEGTGRGYRFGLIALDRLGTGAVGETAGTTVMFAARTRSGGMATFRHPEGILLIH